MPRHVAFLRGVMPTNAKMPDLRRAFEAAGGPPDMLTIVWAKQDEEYAAWRRAKSAPRD